MRIVRIALATAVLFTAVMTKAEASCNKRGNYVAASGHVVKVPRCHGFGHQGAHFRCRDGSFSHSERRRGACSRHGGVAGSI